MEKPQSPDIQAQLNHARENLQKLGNAVSELVNLSPDVFSDEAIKTRLDDFQQAYEEATQRLANPSFRIATIGTTSSGKSTIVNALMGRRIAPMEAGEMSGGVLTLKHSDDRTLVIEATENAVWETGQWTNINDQQLYDRIQIAMHSYHEARKKKEYIAPQITAHIPLLPACDANLSGLPEGINVEFLDLPGLKSVQDKTNLAILQPLVGKAFSLVALDYMQVDEQHRQKLLTELKKVVEYLQGRTDSMIFILNRVDQLGSEDKPLDERLQQLKTEIQEQLNLPSLPDIIPFNARLLYYAQCAWGTNPLHTSSDVTPEVRSRLVESLLCDCANIIKEKVKGDRNLRNWFRQLEDDIEDNYPIDDEKIRQLLNYALKWSGGEELWKCIRLRLNKSFSKLVISPIFIDVFQNYKSFSQMLNSLILTRKICSQDQIKKEKTKIVSILKNLEESIEEIKKNFHEEIQQIIDILKSTERFRDISAKKNHRQEVLMVFDTVKDIEKDLNKLILIVQDAFKNNSASYYLKDQLTEFISPSLAEDVSRQYNNVSSRLSKFSHQSGTLVKKVEADNKSAIQEFERDEKCVRLLYHTMREALTARGEYCLQGQAKLFENFVKSFFNNQLLQLRDFLYDDDLSEINLDDAIFAELEKKISQKPPILPEKFFEFSATIKQSNKKETKVVGKGTRSEHYTVTEYEKYDYYEQQSCFQPPKKKVGSKPVKKTKTRNIQYDITKDIQYKELYLPSPEKMGEQWASGIEKGKDKLWDILRNWILEYLDNSYVLFQESVKDIAHLADRALEKQLHIIEKNFDQEREFWQNFEFTKDQVNSIFEELQKSLD
ncbi:hypothetical protein Cyast_0048 [Cyanobacterium stanieri PCC 7202]|uniref:Dynamin N-terminal domain-containing protein n=1 Tax=Cyanobacterium stanieri (strain ATCC 29140 / PCC 7202) TaxID=292563 RepID=K9YHS3_CYASC|nr:hypothetical protein Cyast_0048 [Cyanobacterium stanieri PCC 7202]